MQLHIATSNIIWYQLNITDYASKGYFEPDIL